jgi:hypothetical protein
VPTWTRRQHGLSVVTVLPGLPDVPGPASAPGRPPNQLPERLGLLDHELAGLAARADRDVAHLLRRSTHHSRCSGDGAVVDLLTNDAHALGAWSGRVRGAAGAVAGLRLTVSRRLLEVAAAEARCRTVLASASATPEQRHALASAVRGCSWGAGGWVATPTGPIPVPTPGDPAWEAMARALGVG